MAKKRRTNKWSCRQNRIVGHDIMAVPDRESLYGIYLHCKQRTSESDPEDTKWIAFVEFFDEAAYGLTETEKRRFLKLVDGMSHGDIADEEECSREAILCSINNMVRKNEYCQVAARLGVLQRRKNQYE